MYWLAWDDVAALGVAMAMTLARFARRTEGEVVGYAFKERLIMRLSSSMLMCRLQSTIYSIAREVSSYLY